jgi:hypothetical protein
MQDGFDRKRDGFAPIEEEAVLFVADFERVGGGMWRRKKDGVLYTRAEAVRELRRRHGLLGFPRDD